ncbi:MAG: thiol:disulfide interchange protein DsbA/DsbL [Gammaproteobacteria bacterium]|nr:thiol:disulfide interchange protein DsbA/DsbL [Gammaproteobacteria bacterium]MDH5692837.1 thiol:disulfide interchange protein DsbA/DsbL [Gammaproteobacteria bacterium]
MRWLKSIALIMFFSLSVNGLVLAEEYEEGVHYTLITPAQPTETGNKVEVREVFWYGCPHCFRFEPTINRWLKNKPAEAEFVRMPGMLVPHWEPHGRAFYVAEMLGVWDKIHEPLFNALHLEKKEIKSEDGLADFFEGFGVKKDDFHKAYRSFAVETKVRRAKQLAKRYGINGVPAIIVNGKYVVSNRNSGGPRETMKIADYLVKKESSK